MCLPYLHHVFYEDKKITPTPRPGSCHHRHAGATHQRQRHRIACCPTNSRAIYESASGCAGHCHRRSGGTGVGISALLDQTTDIAMASRAIKFSEKMKVKAAGEDLAEVPIAYDALAVVVHPSNPVKQLTRQQLEDIFRGKITNWQQVGGDDRKIVVYSRETSSGTYEFFKESVLKNKNYMSSSLSMPATGAIIQSVSQTRGAIGYVGLAYVSPRIKTLAVSYDGQHYAAPTLENATNKTYPIVRPLYYYYNRKNASVVAPLLDFILSAAGQKIIKESGYIPVHNE